MFHKRPLISSVKRQRGSMLVIAIFIMVVMLLVGLGMVNILATSGQSVAYEVSGTRAYAAANSGVQIKLSEIFPLATGGNSGAALRCNDASLSNPSNYNIVSNHSGKSCPVTVTCQDFQHDGVTYYEISSQATCSIGNDVTSRTVVIEARSL